MFDSGLIFSIEVDIDCEIGYEVENQLFSVSVSISKRFDFECVLIVQTSMNRKAVCL